MCPGLAVQVMHSQPRVFSSTEQASGRQAPPRRATIRLLANARLPNPWMGGNINVENSNSRRRGRSRMESSE